MTDRTVQLVLTPELLTTAQGAQLLSISESHFKALERGGNIGPMAVRLGKSKRWMRGELIEWCRAGCPSRQRWVEMREAAGVDRDLKMADSA